MTKEELEYAKELDEVIRYKKDELRTVQKVLAMEKNSKTSFGVFWGPQSIRVEVDKERYIAYLENEVKSQIAEIEAAETEFKNFRTAENETDSNDLG